jgi:hypothetical protein
MGIVQPLPVSTRIATDLLLMTEKGRKSSNNKDWVRTGLKALETSAGKAELPESPEDYRGEGSPLTPPGVSHALT